MPLPPYKLVVLHQDCYLRETTAPHILGIWVANAMLLQNVGAILDPAIPERTQDDVDLCAQVNEGRAKWKGYSGCGDGPGWLAVRAGCRDGRFVNRDDDNLDGIPDDKQDPTAEGQPGTTPWHMGENITRFIAGAQANGAYIVPDPTSADPLARLPMAGMPFFMGDHGLEHVGTFVSEPVEQPDGSYVADTIEGGQVGPLGEQQFQFFRGRTFKPVGKQYVMRGRVLHGWVDVTKLPYTQPAMVPLDCPYGWPLGSEP